MSDYIILDQELLNGVIDRFHGLDEAHKINLKNTSHISSWESHYYTLITITTGRTINYYRRFGMNDWQVLVNDTWYQYHDLFNISSLERLYIESLYRF